MASIKVKLRPSTIAGHKGSIYYQVLHQRMVRQVATDYKLSEGEWKEIRFPEKLERGFACSNFITYVRKRIRQDLDRMSRIIRKLSEAGRSFTAADIVQEYSYFCSEYSLSGYMEGLINNFIRQGRVRTSETYRSTLLSFHAFLDETVWSTLNSKVDKIIYLDCIDSELIESYESWQKKRGNCPNTVSFYMRVLRAVYRRAVDADIIENRNPFRRVYTGVDKTVKRALPLTVIRKISKMDLTGNRCLEYARDMFMLSFYLRGMSLIDMAFLKRDDLKEGYVSYRRRKTGQRLVIEWTEEMQSLVEKYDDQRCDYLLPIIGKKGGDERINYRNKGYSINRGLRKIAGMIGINIPLTLYVARHSWASAAKSNGIPLRVISEGMGHDSESTTRIYLASLDTSVVDRANLKIIRSLR